MRSLLTAAATLLLLSGEAAAAEDTAPVLTAAAAEFDAGRVEASTKVTHTYELRNAGRTPLPIVVKAACGGTATDYDPIVPAGGVGKVTAVLDTTHMRGRIEKTIDVMTNDPSSRRLTLTLKAESVRALVVKPTDTPAVRGIVGALQPVELTVSAPDDAPFGIERVRRRGE